MNTLENVIVATGILLTTSLGGTALAETPKAERNLLANIARDGMLEVQLGELAEKKATNKDVQAFAKHMVTDHSKANDKLKAAAAADKVTLPTEITAQQKAKQDKLAALSGAKFDQKYMEEMVLGHAKAITAVQKESTTGSGQSKAWASETLPVIQEHKKDADNINSKLKS